MAVTDVHEKRVGRSGAVDATWKRRYRRFFRVITNNTHDGPIIAAAGVGIGLGDTYHNIDSTEKDKGSFCVGINATCVDEDGLGWEVEIEYGPLNPLAWPENPLDKPLEIEGGFAPYERIIDVDQNGKAVVNTAGDSFDPPVTTEDPRPVLTIVRNEPSISWPLVYKYRNAVNSDPFWGADPLQVKVNRIAPRRAWDQFLAANFITQGGFYWIVTYEFEFNPDGWRKKVLNQGMRELISGAQHQILVDGIPITSPSLLDQSGSPLVPGATPFYVEFVALPEKEFSVFNLDNPGP